MARIGLIEVASVLDVFVLSTSGVSPKRDIEAADTADVQSHPFSDVPAGQRMAKLCRPCDHNLSKTLCMRTVYQGFGKSRR
jgi:hypothetical protein